MEELAKIIKAISEVTDTDRYDICSKNSHTGATSRYILCAMVMEYYPYLTTQLEEMIDVDSAYIRRCRNIVINNIGENVELHSFVDSVANILRLPKYNATLDRPKKPKISATKTLFGFEYTKDENIRRHNFCLMVRDWFRRESRIGMYHVPQS